MSMLRNLRGKEQREAVVNALSQPQQSPRLSAKAALVAQEMESLEAELAAAMLLAQQNENRYKVAEEKLEDTRARCAQLQSERDHFQKRFLEIGSKLRAAAGVIIDCIREDEGGPEPYRPKSASMTAVARAIALPESAAHEPVPSFLTARRDDESSLALQQDRNAEEPHE